MVAEKLKSEREASSSGASTGSGTGPVRMLHLHAGNLYGGVETVLASLARYRDLGPALEQHFALCFEGRLSSELASAGVPVHLLGPVRISRPWTGWRARRRLRKLLRSECYEAVVCHMPWPLAIFGRTAQAEGLKLLFWAHGYHSGSSWLERMAKKIVPDLAISTSRFVGASVAKLYPHTEVEAVYTPLALINSPEAGQWRTSVRQEHGIRDGQVVILQVSRFESLKGHLLHLQALSQLPGASDWVCWFVGGPQNAAEQLYFREVQETANRLGLASRVRFLGQRSDVARLLAAADIFCQPNQSPDAFGIVFVEALWAGRPVVTTALGGALEVIDPSCGILTEPGSAASLASALARLIGSPDLRSQLGKAGPARARQLCDPATQMHALENLIFRVTRGGTAECR